MIKGIKQHKFDYPKYFYNTDNPELIERVIELLKEFKVDESKFYEFTIQHENSSSTIFTRGGALSSFELDLLRIQYVLDNINK